MLEGLKMGWVFKKPARLGRPTDDANHGLNTMTPLLGRQHLEVSLSSSYLHLWGPAVTVPDIGRHIASVERHPCGVKRHSYRV